MMNIGQRLTICPLICEDLARQDPIAELIRAVGHSLVVAILMDGPQLKDRWSAQYASVLAEDPDSSILTLTSLGMVQRYSTPRLPKPKNVVALWRERDGHMRELELDDDAQALVLSLSVDSTPLGTHDGRKDANHTYTLKFGGLHQIRMLPETRLTLSRIGIL